MENIWYGMIDRNKTNEIRLFIGILTFGLTAKHTIHFRDNTSITEEQVSFY